MDCRRKTDARKAELIQTSTRLVDGAIHVSEWQPSPCLKPAGVLSHQFGITVVNASRGNFRFYGINELRIPPDGRQDLAVNLGFIELPEAVGEIGGLGHLRVDGEIPR